MDAGYRLLAAKYVRKQSKQLRAQFDGIRAAEDIEFVHKARVATRRLMAAMQMFGDCFNRKQLKRWKKAVRRIRSGLSEARDKDVQIELLREILGSLADKACFAGISRLLVEWEYQRERLQADVVKAVDRLQRKGTLKEVESEAKRVAVKAESHEIQEQSPASFELAEQEILGRLDKLLALQDCLSRPDDQQSHHAMRIAAKRLRYTLEIAGPIYSGRLDSTVEAIKQVQTLLGEVHDCDAWQDELDQFAKAQRNQIKSHYGHAGPFTRLNTGIEYFRQNRQQHRQQCFEQLVRLWGELDVQEVWENLVSIVQSDGEPPRPPEASGEEKKAPQSSDISKEVMDEARLAHDASGNGNQEDSPALPHSYAPASGKPAEHLHRPPRPAPVTP